MLGISVLCWYRLVDHKPTADLVIERQRLANGRYKNFRIDLSEKLFLKMLKISGTSHLVKLPKAESWLIASESLKLRLLTPFCNWLTQF